MDVTKLLIIISCLWVGVKSGRLCVDISLPPNDFLQIPDNPLVEPGNNSRSGWYRTVNWKKDYNGDLRLSFERIEVLRVYDRPDIPVERNSQSFSLCDLRKGQEPGSWANIARQALGLSDACPAEKGLKILNPAMFSAQPCQKMFVNFYGDLDALVGKNLISLNVMDDDNNKILTGRLEMWDDK